MRRIVFHHTFWFFLSAGLIGFLAVFLPSLYGGYEKVEGATYSVCASGCDYTTITSAFAAAAAGDTITVGATYASTTETFPLTFPTSSITLDCDTSGAVIGVGSGDSQVDIMLRQSGVLRECSFSNVRITTQAMGNASLTVTENTFATGSQSVVDVDEADSSIISSNTGLNAIRVGNSDDITIQSNTVYHYSNASFPAIYIQASVSTSSDYGDASNVADRVNINGNTIFDYRSSASAALIQVYGGTDNVITANTIDIMTSPSDDFVGIWGRNTTDLMMSANSVDVQGVSGPVCQSVLRLDSKDISTSATIRNNTVKLDSNCVGIDMYDGDFYAESNNTAANDLTAVVSYNIIYNSSASATGTAMQLGKSGTGSSVSISSGHNGFYNTATVTNTTGFASSTISLTLAANSLLTDPYFKDEDADTTNNFELRPYSPYLDVNAGTDIGASAQDRSSSFTIDDDGTIDYTLVHATNTVAVGSSLRASDTMQFKAGTYDGFSVSNTASGITIAGATGQTVVIDATTNNHALSLTGLSSPTVTNVTLQSASNTQTSYLATSMIFDYNGNSYDDSALIGMPAANLSAVINSGSTCTSDTWGTDNSDVTSNVGAATNDWHLALVDVGGAKVGFFVPNNYASTAAALESLCSAYSASVEAWVTSTFAVADGVFTYDSSAISAAGVSLTSGYTSPPALTRVQTKYAGLYMNNVSSPTVTFVTTTDNQYGFYFTGNTGGATIASSTATGSLSYDLYSDSTGNNTIQNLTYNSASSAIASSGNITAAFRARWLIQDASSTPVVGISVFVSSADSSVTTTLTSLVGGYTPFTDFLTAYTLTNASPTSTSNGGYNPYTALTTATGTYNATSLNTSLIEPNQTIPLTLSEGAVVPTAVTDLSTALSSARIRVTWTDNASGNAQEDYYIVDYVQSSSTDDFPGVVATTSQDAEIYSILNAAPNSPYLIRVAGVNSMGTSTYATSSLTYSYAAPPTDVAVTASGQTAAVVSWNANANPSGTVYEVYDVTNSTSTATTTATSYTVTGLSAGGTYEYKVRGQYIASSTLWGTYSSSASTTLPGNDATSVTLTLTKGVSAGFTLASSSHTALFSSVTGTTATLTVSSTPVTFSVDQGSSATIDTNGDGTDDMQVTADSVGATVGVFTLSLYTPSATPVSSGGGGGASAAPVPSILGVLINGLLDALVDNRTITIAPIGVSNVTEVHVSLSSDMTDVTKVPWNGSSIQYTLPEKAGVHTVYVQGESATGAFTKVIATKVVLDYSRSLPLPSIQAPTPNQIITSLPFVVEGTAQPNAAVSIMIAGSIYTVEADEQGAYQATILDQLTPRSYQISVEQSLGSGEKSLRRTIPVVYQPPGTRQIVPQPGASGGTISDTDAAASLFAREVFLPQRGQITQEGVDELVEDASEKPAFLLVLQESSAQFYKTQTEHITALPGEPIELLLRPSGSTKSVTARLYPDDGLSFADTTRLSASWKDRVRAFFAPAAYAEGQSSSLWIDGYLFEKDNQAALYKANIALPSKAGTIYKLIVSVNEEGGSRTHITKYITVPASGEVVSDRDDREVAYAQVDIYKQTPDGSFRLWQGGLYGQPNPLFTSKHGEYAVSVPPGTYYMDVHASGHKQYTSEVMRFDRAGVLAERVVLSARERSLWEQFLEWVGTRFGG